MELAGLLIMDLGDLIKIRARFIMKMNDSKERKNDTMFHFTN